ncbi:MAG: cytochrome b N-terminal domain-containing protein [Verrucomicrobia bacterium]|nr:cytochrome b N-terminal domain-containing protein [Verrucomicrobiota bacterium]
MACLDQRTGYRAVVRAALYENVPGGARWRYVWGSTLTFTFFIQMVTGLFLWLAYSPSSQTAWESVYFIQYQMTGGWLLRGLHHYTAQAMNVLLVLHLLQITIDGAYKAPRELNFWFGLALLMLVLSLSLTGYLLPWDQKGFWATKVATNLMGITPLIGPGLQRIVLGGAEYGHHTLTRFFALHAGVLPAAMVLLIVMHVCLFRRHGLTTKAPRRRPDCAFWPDQVLRDAVACLAVLAVVLFLILRPRLSGAAPGVDLGAPADPSEPYAAARPEWYFLFLFQFLKWFPGGTEVLGAIVIPGVVMAVIAAMPLIGRWNLGHRFNLGFLGALFGGIALLTWLAIAEDRHQPDYQAAVTTARLHAERTRMLADVVGIPPAGAVTLLRNDPLTEGPRLFARHCAACHRFDGTDGLGQPCREEQCASDLKGYASRAWLAGLLDPTTVASPKYFGSSAHRDGDMVKYVRSSVPAFTPEKKDRLRQIIATVSAEAQLSSQRDLDTRDAVFIAEGRQMLADGMLRCTECHQFHKADEHALAPDLTGYGSREWLISFIANPEHRRFYGKRNDRMPRFGEDNLLTAPNITLIADWLRGDWDPVVQATLHAQN